MGIFSEIFSWWGGNTWSNRIYTALRGKAVGTDATGNRYYVQSKGVGPLGVPRRWVIYKDLAEASQVPPEWHGWLHFLVDEPPTAEDYKPRPWQKPHRMNMTGTPEAYRPAGSILASGKRPEDQQNIRTMLRSPRFWVTLLVLIPPLLDSLGWRPRVAPRHEAAGAGSAQKAARGSGLQCQSLRALLSAPFLPA
jgi:NADH:ubiquinone oxidoreductase subunit